MKHFRTLLISLPWAEYQCPNLSIGSLAAYLQQQGHDTTALHLHLEAAHRFGFSRYDEIAYQSFSGIGEALCAAILFPAQQQRFLDYASQYFPNAKKTFLRLKSILKALYQNITWDHYTVVGFTSNYQQTLCSLVFSKWIKRDFPHIRTVIGGRCVAGELGESILRHFPQMDWCIHGEGEIPLSRLLDALQTSKHDFEQSIPGLIFRATDNAIIHNTPEQLTDLKGLPDPDFHHYFNFLQDVSNGSHQEIFPVIPVEESRGCGFNCAFCCEKSFWGCRRARPAKEIADSIARQTNKYHIASIYLVAQTITPESSRTLFSHITAQNRNYKIHGYMRAMMPKDILKLTKEAGVVEATVGIEALNSSILRKMRKGTRLIDNLEIMKYCEELGIGNISCIMTQFPNETQREVDATVSAIDFACAYKPPGTISAFQLREGSPVYLRPKHFGIKQVGIRGDLESLLSSALGERICFWYKDFKRINPLPRYNRLQHRFAQWENRYREITSDGWPLLYYLDLEKFLRIEDRRFETRVILLDEWIRDLYLFCDEIRSFKEIRERFKEVPEKELRKVLRKLFKLKVMYTEDDDWLSLAIHASPENRRHMPFL